MKKVALLVSLIIIATACVSKKEYVALQAQHKKTKNELLAVKNSLTKCLIEKEKCEAQVTGLNKQIVGLKDDKKKTLEYVDNLTILTKGANDNIKETLNQLSQKDQYINRIRSLASKKDSLNLVVAFQLKKELKDGIDDEDIEINVEKTVVYISISDKLLFKSGSYNVADKAYKVLEKVATVVKKQPEMDVMIEGHTDDTPVVANSTVIKDNWDLSVKRATAITRILQEKYDVKPGRLIAAGRSSYQPLVPNDSPAAKAKNRRTKIIILPKINQFFELLEQKADE